MKIVEQNYSVVPVDSISEHPRNPRKGKVSAIAESVDVNGFYGACIVQRSTGYVLVGNHRLKAAKKEGAEMIPVIFVDVDDKKALRILKVDNRTSDLGSYNQFELAKLLDELYEEDGDLAGTGYDVDDLDELIAGLDEVDVAAFSRKPPSDDIDEEPLPEAPEAPRTKTGDIWQLGHHRVMCGDSTKAEDVAALMDGETATLIHADPPYGMGKESDGVANDNIYGDKLDEFQMAWWNAFRPHVDDYASVYIWGNAPDLWRLWYVGGLRDSEQIEFRNEIVWDKSHGHGMSSATHHSYASSTERCLFLQIGKQFQGNINTEDFPDEWAPLLAYFQEQAEGAGITSKTIVDVCGVQMFGHWFSPSQFCLVPKRHYETLAATYEGFFLRDWNELKKEFTTARRAITRRHQEGRSYFDNEHDAMRDVWTFDRVYGDERHGHATPKPVEMMARVMKSSLPDGGLCVEPFGGSGSTLIGAETTGRRCFTMELSPAYVDVIVKRWENLTGETATLVER